MADDASIPGNEVINSSSTPTTTLPVVVTSTGGLPSQALQLSPSMLQATFQSALGNWLQQSTSGEPTEVTLASTLDIGHGQTVSSPGGSALASLSLCSPGESYMAHLLQGAHVGSLPFPLQGAG